MTNGLNASLFFCSHTLLDHHFLFFYIKMDLDLFSERFMMINEKKCYVVGHTRIFALLFPPTLLGHGPAVGASVTSTSLRTFITPFVSHAFFPISSLSL